MFNPFNILITAVRRLNTGQTPANEPLDTQEGSDSVLNIENRNIFHNRRQDILRVFLILSLILFFFEGANESASNGANQNKSQDPSMKRKIVIPQLDMTNMKLVISSTVTSRLKPLNVTGMFRGRWKQNQEGRNQTNSVESGNLFLQLDTIEISGLPELSFAYGLVRTYDQNKKQQIVGMFNPVQGVIITDKRKLSLFSTPYKTQKLVVQIVKSSLASPSERLTTNELAARNATNVTLNRSTIIAGNYIFPFEGGKSPSVQFTHPNGTLQMNIFVIDTLNSSEAKLLSNGNEGNGEVRTFVLGDNLLSSRFRLLQTTRPTFNTNQANSTLSGTLLPLPHRSKICQYFLDIDLPQTASPVGEEADQVETSRSSIIPVEDDFEMEKIKQMSGLLSSSPACARSLSLSVISFDFQFDVLQRKVDIYSLVLFLLSLLQLALVVLQMRHLATQATASKVSITCMLAQAMLDAVICLSHLLLGAALPNIFFSSFIWISIVKLLLFSLFQMRIVINAYQARYAQEIAQEGWRGLRTRLVNLHLRFYGTVVFVLVVSLSFPSRPILIMILLYSFWWPQIIFSAYNGTRHPFHSIYLFGTSLTRLFLPFYILSCPRNFVVMIWEYLSPSFDASTAGAHNPFTSLSVSYFLIFWLAVQLVLMSLQSYYGPRFFVPKTWLPTRYDYHRPLPIHLHSMKDTAARIHVQADSERGDLETGSLLPGESGLECVICYNPIYLNVSDNYMITPCDHMFHEPCLRQWMAVKLECPVCRTSLPPAEDDLD